MEKQEIYDKVCAHLAQQKRKATSGGSCCYRTPNGMKCAIGCLIPDELYDPAMDFNIEGNGVGCGEVFEKFPAILQLIGAENDELCESLQSAHDSSLTAVGIRAQLQSLADDFEIAAGAEQAITEWN